MKMISGQMLQTAALCGNIPQMPPNAKIALDACKALGLTFGGVDILQGGILCEVNSNAHIINIMNCTGVDIAPLIFEEIKSRL